MTLNRRPLCSLPCSFSFTRSCKAVWEKATCSKLGANLNHYCHYNHDTWTTSAVSSYTLSLSSRWCNSLHSPHAIPLQSFYTQMPPSSFVLPNDNVALHLQTVVSIYGSFWKQNFFSKKKIQFCYTRLYRQQPVYTLLNNDMHLYYTNCTTCGQTKCFAG